MALHYIIVFLIFLKIIVKYLKRSKLISNSMKEEPYSNDDSIIYNQEQDKIQPPQALNGPTTKYLTTIIAL
jgi:hypothetical protein